MSRRIVIDPVSRIEGHVKISIFLDEAGRVSDARFHVTEFRGFEQFCQGRPFWEMAGISARICGICPISHLMASAKAGDRILAVDIPPAAEKLRRLMNLGQIIQSHALSFFHLSAPDLLLGWDSPPEKRNAYYRPLGFPAGAYRVGPLARLNVCSHFGTPLADAELAEFRQRGGRTVQSSFFYHYARLVEIVGAAERLEQLLADSDLSSDHLRAHAGVNRLEGVGVSEAPRGTLFHHYQVDDNGLLRKVNLIIATGQNNLAMNRTVAQVARHYVTGPSIPEAMLNRVEASIRAFDPCLSCSTHADGQVSLHVALVGPDGRVLDEKKR